MSLLQARSLIGGQEELDAKELKRKKKKSYADGKDGYLPGPRSAQGLGLDFDTLGGPVQ